MTSILSVWRRSATPLTVVALCFALGSFGAAPTAAEQRPRTNTKHVCDWEFVAGPRAGTKGKESRAWLGQHPTYTSTAWWKNGTDGSAVMTYSNGSTTVHNGRESTLWNVTATASGVEVYGPAVLQVVSYRSGVTQRSFHAFTNGGELDCLALGFGALEWIRQAYWRAGAVCDCRGSFGYAATVGCVESCAAWWNDNSKWPLRPAPACLQGSLVVDKAACLLDNDPRLNIDPKYPL